MFARETGVTSEVWRILRRRCGGGDGGGPQSRTTGSGLRREDELARDR